MKELFRYIQSDYYRYTGEMRGGGKNTTLLSFKTE